jgi:hypothetical protein
MAKSFSFVTSVLVAAVLAVPTISAGQGRSRGGDDGGSAGGRSGSGSGEVAVPRSAPEPMPAPAPRSSEPSQPTYSSPGSSERGSSGQATARSRGDQPIRGYAQPRTNVPRGGGPTYVTVWPSWYYGGYYGYSGYPYGYYGSTGYWNRYGLYDPFLFDPYGYYGGYYGSPYLWGPEIGNSYDSREYRTREATGSIRLKVNPKHAKVYIDGALAGVADEFDGLANHLEIAPGPHQLELRAEGFETYTGQVNVKEDRTQTERINLKKR